LLSGNGCPFANYEPATVSFYKIILQIWVKCKSVVMHRESHDSTRAAAQVRSPARTSTVTVRNATCDRISTAAAAAARCPLA